MTAIGERAPTFELPDTEGKLHEPGDAPATVVAFTCNHCPYALAWHERIVAIAHDYADRGVRVLAINPNDVERYPRDSPEQMLARVEQGEFDGVPYLFDESQEVAHAYGGLVTRHPMLFGPDRKLLYQGRIDDNVDDPAAVHHPYLADAIDAALAGRPVVPAARPVLGCSVKWKA
jgi:peroxiredoxin